MTRILQPDPRQAVARLHDDPNSVSVQERQELAKIIADALLCHEIEQDESVARLLDRLSGDPDWSVRMEVARVVHLLSDHLSGRLIARFRGDTNMFVRSHAERSLTRQRKSAQSTSLKWSECSCYADEISQLERQYGKKLAMKVRSLSDRRYAMLTSAVSHDVRSVLTTLISNSAAMEHESPGSRRVRSIREDIQHLQRVIEAMEQFTKPLPVHRHPEDVAEIVAQAIEKARAGVGQQGYDDAAVQIIVPPHPRVQVQVTRSLLVLALTNIIQNAIEAFARYGEDALSTGRIEVQVAVDGYETQIIVRDSGPGIEPEVIRELRTFIPGGPNKAKRRSSGWGISIAQRYIAAHGGRLAIESEVDRGTTVTITLPMREATEENDQ